MLQYVIQRLALVVVVLVAVSMLVFAITAILPGSGAHLILGQFAAPDQVKALELKLGLGDPLWLPCWRGAPPLPARGVSPPAVGERAARPPGRPALCGLA